MPPPHPHPPIRAILSRRHRQQSPLIRVIRSPLQPPKSHKITTILTSQGASSTTPDRDQVLRALLDCVSPANLNRKKRRQQRRDVFLAPPFDAAVVLASRGFAGWLDDPGFVGPLVRMTGRNPAAAVPPPAAVPGKAGFSVLSAVVEGLVLPEERQPDWGQWKMRGRLVKEGRREGGGDVVEGFAVVQGYRDELLPGLWEGKGRRERGDGRAGLVFRLPGLAPERSHGGGVEEGENAGGEKGEGGGEMDVTVPVANTVFQNGRTSTLFATRWAGETWAQLRAVESMDVASQVVRVPVGAGEQTGLAVPLLAITPLRMVDSALGNILKKLFIDWKPVPASKELEDVVPKLLASRRRMRLSDIQGPLNVWALVVPARLAGRRKVEVLELLDVQPWLAEGCRLHRVLSGGGGWGAKQGLLSLDPEAKFETTDEEDVENFERDFLAGRMGGGGGGSVVGPGDEVVFCVDTQTYPKPSAVEQVRASRRFVVKVMPETAEAPETADEVPANRLWARGASTVDDFFGVVSSAVFVGPAPASDAERDGTPAHMKIDTPGAELFTRGTAAAERVSEVEAPVSELAMEDPSENSPESTAARSDEATPDSDELPQQEPANEQPPWYSPEFKKARSPAAERPSLYSEFPEGPPPDVIMDLDELLRKYVVGKPPAYSSESEPSSESGPTRSREVVTDLELLLRKNEREYMLERTRRPRPEAEKAVQGSEKSTAQDDDRLW